MGKKGKKSKKDIRADLDAEIDRYEVEESDDEFSDNERIMIDNARGRKSRPAEEEVLKVYSSTEDEDEESEDMESDLDKKEEGLPDSKAWGKKRKDFYDTDYVDKDFTAFDDEEAALMEESEADRIQKRICAEMEETDFSLGLFELAEAKKLESKKVTIQEKEVVETDLTKLSLDELRDILNRESPEFMTLISSAIETQKYLQEYIDPILDMEIQGEIPDCQAVRFLNRYKAIAGLFTTNILVYLLMKSRREKIDSNHPIFKRLGLIKVMLKHMHTCLSSGLEEQLKNLIKYKAEGLPIVEVVDKPTDPINRKQRRLQKQLENKKRENDNKKAGSFANKILGIDENVKSVTFESESGESEESGDETIEEKRAVSYKILKNKGLTPKRKKEVRNPRVKNRNKYKKAVVRRKGQVRLPRTELSRYSGEMTGIKKNVSKSIKLS